MEIIQPIGEVAYPNKEGYFASSIDQDQPLQKNWQQPVKLCLEEVQKHLPNIISSIYVRGSVARGAAITGISDIDLVVIVKNPLHKGYSREWVRPFTQQLRNRYPQVDDVEVEIVTEHSLLNINQHMGIRVLLTLQGKLLIGDDVLKRLPHIKPDDSSFVHIPTFSDFQCKLKDTLTGKDVFLPAYIPWVTKRYIRTGFELCIEKEEVFTRDLYPCYEIFSRYYPDKKNEMYRVLEQAIQPKWSQAELLKYVDSLGNWLQLEVKKKYPEYC